jgi:hypothetical protein
MEILPGEGVALAKVGESRDVVESRVGPPVHPGRHRRAVYETSPMLVLTYTDDDTVEVVEIGYAGDGGDEVCFDGVQLTFRFVDDVVELGLSRDVAEQGAPKAAAIIDRSELAQLTEAYGVLREVLPDPEYTNARTYVQDVLVRRAGTIAEREKFDAAEIRALFANGTPSCA